MSLFLHLYSQRKHFTMKPFSSQAAQSAFCLRSSTELWRTALGRLGGGWGTKGQIAKWNVSSSLGQFLCVPGVCVLGSREGGVGRGEELRTTWKEEGRPSPRTNIPLFLKFFLYFFTLFTPPFCFLLFLCLSFIPTGTPAMCFGGPQRWNHTLEL